jgi:dynamin 1-like protein
MNKRISDALKNEEQYFRTHQAYYTIANRLGVPYLAHTLNQVIVNHIKRCLPMIRSQITAMLFSKEKELKTLQLFRENDTQNES